MKKLMIMPVIAAGVFCAVNQSTARMEGDNSLGITVRGGPFFVFNGADVNCGGNPWFDAGVEYQVGTCGTKKVNAKESISYSISVDYAGRNFFGGRGAGVATLSTVPILANIVYRSNGFVASAGAGIGVASEQVAGGIGFAQRSATTFAYQGTVGYEFAAGSVPLGVEVRFLGNSDPRRNGVGTNLFIRF